MIRSIFLRKARGTGDSDGLISETLLARSAIFFCSLLLLAGGVATAFPQTVFAQTEPSPDQLACMANGTCTCELRTVGPTTGPVQRLVCTQVTGGATTTTVVNPNTGGGVTSTQNPDGSIENEVIPPRSEGASCSAFDVGACIRALPGMLFTGIAFLFLTLSTVILGVAGTVFNWVVIRTVFQFGTYFGTNEGMLIAWGVMRDVANIGLLFGFIFMGVLLILNVEGGGGHGHGGGMSAKKAIPRLIIFAVLLNFSLFASQVVIDVANAFSASFATLAGETCATGTTGGDATEAQQRNEECANVGISGKILAVTGLTKTWNVEQGWDNLLDRPYTYAVSLMLLSIFVLVTAMVLLAGAILLIIRVVILSLLMVTSPIGFAGMAIPKLQGIATMWWSKLMSQAFFAPVYLLLIFISIKLTEGLMGEGSTSLADALIGNAGKTTAGNMQVVMIFLVVIGFMIGSLIAATKIGAMGAKFATQSVAGATVGFAGFAGRRTIGAASGKAASRIASSSWARNNGVGSRLAYNIASKGAASSFSARTGINNITKGAGLDIGNAGKNVSHGLHGIEGDEVKKRVEFSEKFLKQTKEEKAEEGRLNKVKEDTKNAKAVEIARRTKEKVDEQKAVEQLQSENEAESTRRLLDIDAQGQRVALAEANASSDPETVLREKRTLDEMKREHAKSNEVAAQAVAERKQEIKVSQARHEQNIASFDREIKEIDKMVKGGEYFNPETGKKDTYVGVSADAARRTYAKSMEHAKVPIPGSVGTHINHEAAEKILKKLNRSQNEKLIDAIKETAKEGSGDKDDHGDKGGDKAPADKDHGAKASH